MRRQYGIITHRESAATLVLLGALAVWPAPAPAQGSAGIYSCVDAQGRKLTSDRPILECASRDQRLLNADGSVRKVLPPVPTAEERTQAEAAERRVAAERAAQQEAVRRDRNLMSRYPNEAAHQRAREAALDNARKALRTSEDRLKLLADERKPLLAEAEFYAGKPLPPKLKQALDANDAMVDAQRALVQSQQDEIRRVDALFDAELERLKRLWAGAAPGTLGPMAAASAPPVPRKATP
jgi:hypothetical protein